MATVYQQITSADQAICNNISELTEQRALLSQNALGQLRNLVEGIAVLLHKNSLEAKFDYPSINDALVFIKGKGQFSFLNRFHKLLQKVASHYTFEGDTSERLMLKYFEYLCRTRNLVKKEYQFEILTNLDDFPIHLDPSLGIYHKEIANKIESSNSIVTENESSEVYYIHKASPFYVHGEIYYEVSFYQALNKVNKANRLIAFTKIDLTDKYATKLTLRDSHIQVLNQKMPIKIISYWEISIRPCEFDNFAQLLNIDLRARRDTPEYQYLMQWLTLRSSNLLDLIETTDEQYEMYRQEALSGMVKPQIFRVLDKARQIIKASSSGSNILRYLILRMNNQIIKQQLYHEECWRLSHMKLKWGCIPFDDMPLCSSLIRHNPTYWDLIESIDVTNCNHELLVRHVKNNVEHHGVLYTPTTDLNGYSGINELISAYNERLYPKHREERSVVLDKGHIFIQGYENKTVSIIKRLQELSGSGVGGYTQAVEFWLKETTHHIDDHNKQEALKNLFSKSCVSLIYGAAGTGKSTMVDHIANYLGDKSKLFLAHTNPAIDNLRRKVNAQKSVFRTIKSQLGKPNTFLAYDLLVIDECSTVSNTDLIKILETTNFKLLVLVGDIHQIESIQFGNWFETIRSFIPGTSVFELEKPYRSQNSELLEFWKKIRNIDDDITEHIAHNSYSTELNQTLFKKYNDDEITLCLNYDGLYGINNINRFLQSANSNSAVNWKAYTYKVGDPILFSDSERFRPIIYNNLKGKIVNIESKNSYIQFDIDLDRPLDELDVQDIKELEWLEGSTVRFIVYESDSADDDESLNTSIPFQLAYAVSIHKAQGLEYNSVKVVITEANKDDISHNIFYTAITRAKEHLQIFWTPETQDRVIKNLQRRSITKDTQLLIARNSL